MTQLPTSFEPKRIYAMSIISSIADQVDSSAVPAAENHVGETTRSGMNNDLKGVISDKIHFEDFCYNYQNYVLEESIQLSNNFRKRKKMTKADLIERVTDFFTIDENEACLLFFSGHGKTNGNFILETGEEDCSLSLRELERLWDNRRPRSVPPINDVPSSDGKKVEPQKNKNNHLLLILDFCYSGQWVLRFNTLSKKRLDISIQASCKPDEPSNDQSNFGGLFINNFLHVNGYRDIKYNDQTQSSKLGPDKKPLNVQTPTAYGDANIIWEIYRLQANFNGWVSMAKRKKKAPEGEFIFTNGDRYIGQFKNIQLNGKGKKIFKNGTIMEGNFLNDKLEGSGSISLNNGFTCEGIFKKDQIHSFYEAVLTTGEICKGENYQNELYKGQTKFYLRDSELYEGEFLNNKYFGPGKLFLENGEVYQGEFENEKKHGAGKYFYYTESNDQNKKWFKTLTSVQEGTWKEGKRFGLNYVFEFQSKKVFFSNYEGDQPNGPSNQRKTDGYFLLNMTDERKNGDHVIWFVPKTKNLYVGMMKDNQKQGIGRTKFKNKSIFLGQYIKGVEDKGKFIVGRKWYFQGKWKPVNSMLSNEKTRIDAMKESEVADAKTDSEKKEIEKSYELILKNSPFESLKSKSVRDGEFLVNIMTNGEEGKVFFYMDEII